MPCAPSRLLFGARGPTLLLDGIMYRNQLGTVRKRRLHLHIMQNFRNAFHDIITIKQSVAKFHQFGDSSAIARAFHDSGAYKGHGFRIIELETSGLASLGQQVCGKYQQFVFFAWC
jgi:hypothetical protein